MKPNIVRRETVYQGKFVTIRHDTLNLDGKEYIREVVESGTGVLIAAVTDKNQIILIKQYRHNHGNVYEVPAGAIKPGETPLQAAKRELKEETGIRAKSWKLISTHHNGVHNEGLNYFFLAKDISVDDKPGLDEDELIRGVELVSFEQANSLMKQHRIPDLRNRACIWCAQLAL
jgi:ADP-ribose pyrophosphatase